MINALSHGIMLVSFSCVISLGIICFIEELALTFRLSNCPTSVPWRRNPDADSGVDLAKSVICNGARGRT